MTMRAQGAATTFLPGNVVARTTTYTVLPADSLIVCDATAAGFTVTLPPAVSSKYKHILVQKTDATANVITIAGNAAELINAANTFVQGATAGILTHLFCDGTKWYIVGHNH